MATRISPFTGQPLNGSDPVEGTNRLSVQQRRTPERISPFTRKPLKVEAKLSPFTGDVLNPEEAEQKAREPQGVVGGVFDILSRGQYFSIKLIDALKNEDLGILPAFGAAFSEAIDPKERLEFRDLMDRDWVENNSGKASVLNFIGNVLLDPTTYISFGATALPKVVLRDGAEKIIGRTVVELSDEGLSSLRKLGLETVDDADAVTKVVDGDWAGVNLSKLITSLPVEEASKLVKPKPESHAIVKALGLDRISESIKSLEFVSKLGETFNRNWKLPEEYVFYRDNYLRELQGIVPKVQSDALNRYSKYTKAERENIGKVLSEIDDETTKEVAKLGRNLNPAEEQALFQARVSTLQEEGKLTTKEFAEVVRFRQDMANVAALETEAGILTQLIGNYTPRYYEAIKDAKSFLGFRKKLREGQAHFLGENEARQFETQAQALLAGYKPVHDVAALYAIRVSNSRRVLAQKQFDDTLDHIFGVEILEEAKLKTAKGLGRGLAKSTAKEVEEFKTLPDEIIDLPKPTKEAPAKPKPFKKQVVEEGGESAAALGFTTAKAVDDTPLEIRKYLEATDPLYKKDVDKALPNKPLGNDPDSLGFVTEEVIPVPKTPPVGPVNATIDELLDLGFKTVDSTDNSKVLRSTVRREVPLEVQKDLAYIGEGLYSNAAYEAAGYWLRAFDKAQGIFKTFATVVRPSFVPRQLVGNTLQVWLSQGIKGFGAFDPRVLNDAFHIVSNDSHSLKGIRTTFGNYISGDDLRDLAIKHGMIRGQALDVVSGAKSQDKFIEGLQRELGIRKGLAKVLPFESEDARQGLSKAILAGSRYMSWSTTLEDLSNTALFINGLRMGHSPSVAADLTKKALFDYSNNLSQVEAKLFKRIVPFYSYQRFALPLVARAIANTPGRVANLDKTTQLFFETYSRLHDAEPLTEEQRRVLPGWLLEQPRALEANLIPEQKAVYRTFNSFSPLDIFGVLRSSDDGELDVQGTLQKGFLSQLTPFVKLPIELAFGKALFTGREFQDKIKEVDPDVLMGHFMGTIFAKASTLGAPGYAAGRTLGEAIPSETVLRAAIGWEPGLDFEGKPTVYVSPWRMHLLMAAFPGLHDGLKLGRQDYDIKDKLYSTLFGVGKVTVDFQKEKQEGNKKVIREIREEVEQLRRLQATRPEGYEVYQREFKETMREMMSHAQQ